MPPGWEDGRLLDGILHDRGAPQWSRGDLGMTGRGRLCIYSPYLYPVASGGEIEFVGGTEVRQWALARGLAERGFEVSIATCDFGQGPTVVLDGVTLLRTYRTSAGLPGLRLLYPRLWRTTRTLQRARADVYLANGSGIAAGWAYDAARLRGTKFVFLAASDYDALRSLPRLKKSRERWWYVRALRGADACVAQTDSQRRLLHDNFGVESEVIPNPVELPAAPIDPGANELVLWLSTYKPHKRPEWFIEIARRLPHLRFLMIGLPGSGEATGSWDAAERAAAAYSNLQVHGFVEHARIGEFLRKASLFVHTSPVEGFPMTFLEAWSYGIPSVTTVDPGGTVARHRMGEVVGSVEGLVEAVSRIMASPDTRRMLGARARQYIERHHGPDQTYEPLAALLEGLVRTGRIEHASK
jgi:glycosyltransferase involved in cell wall biosynthesis